LATTIADLVETLDAEERTRGKDTRGRTGLTGPSSANFIQMKNPKTIGISPNRTHLRLSKLMGWQRRRRGRRGGGGEG
jgi:hypothetical protein